LGRSYSARLLSWPVFLGLGSAGARSPEQRPWGPGTPERQRSLWRSPVRPLDGSHDPQRPEAGTRRDCRCEGGCDGCNKITGRYGNRRRVYPTGNRRRRTAVPRIFLGTSEGRGTNHRRSSTAPAVLAAPLAGVESRSTSSRGTGRPRIRVIVFSRRAAGRRGTHRTAERRHRDGQPP
jgi:hypothetical protein